MAFPNLSDPYLGLDPFVFAILVIWSFIWKGLSMWKAAKKNSKVWFVILLVFNTLGILEILYLFIFSEMKPKLKKRKIKNKK